MADFNFIPILRNFTMPYAVRLQEADGLLALDALSEGWPAGAVLRLSSLHDTDTESTSASSRKRNFFIEESRLKFVSGPAVRSGTAGQKRDGNLCVPSRERVAVIRPLPGSCPRT